MTSRQRTTPFILFVASLCANWLLIGCAEKSDTTPSPSVGSKDKSNPDFGDDGEDGGTGDGSSSSTGPFDLCTGLEAKKGEIDGFSSYVEELCSGDNKLVTLRKSENIFKGSDPKLLKKTDKSDGKTVAVRLFTSTVVAAKASDYFAMIRLQVSKPDKFGENYEHDSLIVMSDVDATSTSSSFHYQYSDGDGNVDYTATTRFYMLKKGAAYVSATKLDKAVETMKDIKGLIIVNQKDSTHTEVFTMSDQTYEVAADQKPELYDSKATEKAGLEQQRMFKNADTADKAAALLK